MNLRREMEQDMVGLLLSNSFCHICQTDVAGAFELKMLALCNLQFCGYGVVGFLRTSPEIEFLFTPGWTEYFLVAQGFP